MHTLFFLSHILRSPPNFLAPSGIAPYAHFCPHKIAQIALCPCGLYLDSHGPENERKPTHAFLDHLKELGNEYEHQVSLQLPHSCIPEGSIPSRAQYTLDLMRQGVERIYQPVLSHDDLLGIPDFLERVESPSVFGSFSYRPIDVKISTTAHPEQIAQLAFYGLLLDFVQGVVPETGDILLANGERESIELAPRIAGTWRAINRVSAIQNGREELPTLSSQCSMCQWNDYCLRTLQEMGDISLLDGLGMGKKGALNGAGYTSLTDIAQANPEMLSEVRGIGELTANRMVMQAQVLLDDEPRILSIPDFPDVEVELYLDMECQQATQVIYLIGVLECKDGAEEFEPFLAGSPDEEGRMWAEFLTYLKGLPENIAIYHYHNFESAHLRKLADRHGMESELEDKLFGNLIDLHRVLKESAVLPAHSYGLKTVAKWMGFKWRETDSDAAMSMLWFDLWLNMGEKKYLDLAVEYNEDDCRATKVIRDWLELL